MDKHVLLFSVTLALAMNYIVKASDNNVAKDSIDDLWTHIPKCQVAMKEHMATNQNQSIAIEKLEGIIRKQTVTIKHLQTTIQRQNTAHAKFNEEMRKRLATLGTKVNKMPDVKYDQNGVGCFMDVIELNCLGNGTISITNAIFGKYSDDCSDCCAPSPQDCTVRMSDLDPSDWYLLVNKCDGQTNCSHQYTGEIINDCEPGYMADYMQIFYTCPPENVVLNEAIGFTARHPNTTDYSTGDIINFSEELTDLGNNYNAHNYTFVCPISGMYIFSVSLNAQEDLSMHINIMRDKEEQIEALAHGAPNNYLRGTASAVVVLQCEAFHIVYVVAASDSYMEGMFKAGHFSGALIQRF